MPKHVIFLYLNKKTFPSNKAVSTCYYDQPESNELIEDFFSGITMI